MNRVRFLKIAYILILFIVVSAVFIIAKETAFPDSLIFLAVVIIVCLIPGRITGYYFRDFYTARRLLSQKSFEKSVEHNRQFLQAYIEGKKV
ncbi:MAG: hypothetical protein GX384_08540 [Clostridiaceae bacterium]|jgi:uncharacterized membrane protein|nr:hypothetical protein [Clostridiaceae bacterium]